jgi:hypothetical protein
VLVELLAAEPELVAARRGQLLVADKQLSTVWRAAPISSYHVALCHNAAVWRQA